MASRRHLAWLALVALGPVAACAKGNAGRPDGGPGPGDPDADIIDNPDAQISTNPDAAPMMRTLTQTTNDTIVALNSVSCNQDDGLGNQTHDDNSYFRVFDLPGQGINSAFTVTGVTIGIETAVSGTGTQPATVRLHRLNGPVSLANLSPLGSASINIADQDATLLNVPISGTAPAGSQLVVELFTPAGHAAGNNLFIGSNAAGESAPSYVVAAACSINDMMTTGALGFPTMHVVMKVTGTYNP